MKPLFPLALALGALALTGCAQGNLRTPAATPPSPLPPSETPGTIPTPPMAHPTRSGGPPSMTFSERS